MSGAFPAASPEPAGTQGPRRVLVGGVGYRFLRDLSFGPLLTDGLRKEAWPEGVEIEDLSYGPVAILHNLDARPRYDRLVLVAGVKRGRPPGSVHQYRWDGRLPGEEEIQARVEEAGSGVISLDNLLVFLTYFRRMPEEVVVIEVEGAAEDWGEGFTPEVERATPQVVAMIRELTGTDAARPAEEPGDAAARRMLVAGFGNLLLGDDGFGVRVLERLSKSALPPGVELLEVGTGGLNLVLTLMGGFTDLVVIDAVRHGRPPGTLCAFQPGAPGRTSGETGVDPHFAEPTRAMGLAAALGMLPDRVTVVGCEPESCELGMELSPAVAAAVDGAAEAIREMIADEGKRL
jgi:hydrogenase maturation protease